MSLSPSKQSPKLEDPKGSFLNRALTFFAEQKAAFAKKIDTVMDAIIEYPTSDEKKEDLLQYDSAEYAAGKAILANDLRQAVEKLSQAEEKLLSRIEDTVGYAISKQEEVEALTKKVHDLETEIEQLKAQLASQKSL